MSGASRQGSLAGTVALAGLTTAGLLGLLMLIAFAFGPLRLFRGGAARGRPSEESEESPAPSAGEAPEETPQPDVESAIIEEAAPAEAGEAVVEEVAPAKPRNRLRGLLGWALYLAVIVGAIALGPTALGWALNSDYPLAAISSGSMWPALKEGDVVLLKGVDSIDDVKVGDIIAFRHKDGFAIHRIAKIEGEQITTKGDANSAEDQPISIDDVIGKVPTIVGRTARVPYLGNISFLLSPLMNQTDDPGQPPQAPSPSAGLGSGSGDSGAGLPNEGELP